MIQPSTNGDNGRGPGGRFAKGNPGGPGNPLARRVQRLRAELLRAVPPERLRKIVEALAREAETGDVAACRELLNRCLGPAEAFDLAARLEALEQLLAERAVP